MNIPKDHSFISFDIKSSFSYVALDFTIIEEFIMRMKHILTSKDQKCRPFQERRAIARTHADTRAKVFRRVINRMRK